VVMTEAEDDEGDVVDVMYRMWMGSGDQSKRESRKARREAVLASFLF